MNPNLTIDEIKNRIAILVSEYMGVDIGLILSGSRFDTLIQNFDSLAMIEIQLLLEKEYGFDFSDDEWEKGTFPVNIDELAEAFLQLYHRQQEKQKAELAG